MTPESYSKGSFREQLSPVELELFVTELSRALNVTISTAEVQEAEKEISGIRNGMTGRFAGDVDDYLILYFFSKYQKYSSAQSTLPHAEIGSLFGGSSIITLKGIRSGNGRQQIVCIDPLDGYYTHQNLGGTNDVISKLPINQETLVKNLGAYGFTGSDFQVLRYLSVAPEVASFVKKQQFQSAFIDGDHSYKGLKYDWDLLAPQIAEGGWVIIDNVLDYVWPEVSKFVYERLLASQEWRFELVFSRSVVLRKTKAKGDEFLRAHFLNSYRQLLRSNDQIRSVSRAVVKSQGEVELLQKELNALKATKAE